MARPEGTSGTPADARAVLSRDLSIFLVQLSIALSKTKTYPPGHPAMAAAVTAVLQRLRTALQGRAELAIGVARHQLILEGRATDAGHPVLRDLALRLHRNQLVALHLLSGIELAELTDLLSSLGAETWRQGRPLGLEPRAVLERWPHARIQPLELRQLEIGSDDTQLDDPGGHAGHLWLGLAAAAMLESGSETDPGDASASPPPPEKIGRAINERRGNPAYDKVIAGYLLGLSQVLAEGSPAQTATLRQRLTGLLQAMDAKALGLLLGSGTDPAQRLGLLFRVAKVLPVEAVLKLLEATAAASQQNISHAVLRILQKLAAQVDVGDPSQGFGAEAAVRDTVHQLVSGMSLEDPNPGTYRRLLELLAHDRPATGRSHPQEGDRTNFEALRIIRTSLEVGATGEAVWRAIDELVDHGGLAALLNHLDRCEGELPAQEIWERLASVPVVQRLLVQDDLDLAALERVLERLGAAAAEPMLDSLEGAENLTLRRRLLSRLGEMGESLGPLIAKRLPGKPWYVQRNLLLLMGAITSWPPDFSPLPYVRHPDARVRREAYKLLLMRSESRVSAVTTALADADPGIVRLGLTAALEGPVASAFPPLLVGLNGRYRDPELVILAIRVLGLHDLAEARGWLIRNALTKPRWFRRRRLVAKSPVLLAALAALAARWSRDSEVGAVLRIAAAHHDPEVRAAARPPTT